jgi:polyisoprenoid-binding protein YceI
MIRKTVLVSFVILVTSAAYADSRIFNIKADGKNVASFHLPDAFESIDGSTTAVSGTIVADSDDAGASSVEVSIDLASLDTGIALRNRHMRDRYVETSKYPHATFKSVAVSAPETAIAANRPVELTVTGDFTMHGVTKRLTAQVRVTLIPESDITLKTRGRGDWIHAVTSFKLTLSDFGINVPEGLVDGTLDASLDVFALAAK